MKSHRIPARPGLMVFSIIAILCAWATSASADAVPFDSDRWTVAGGQVVEHLGRTAFMGMAFLNNVDMADGIIEVDIAVTGARSYPGIDFRIQSQSDYERMYLRPHRAGLYPDALQYTPSFNGISGWQLYNGPGATAMISLPENEWVHVKMEISGTQANVYVGDDRTPALVITDLRHGFSSGKIGVNGPTDGSAYFSNFSYAVTDDIFIPPPPPVDPPPGLLTEWEISEAFPYSDVDLESYPGEALDRMTWQTVASESSGLIDLARYTAPIPGEAVCIYARKTFAVEKDSVLVFEFGYSDLAAVFANGTLMFIGSSGYQQRDPSFLGIVGFNDDVFIPLHPGKNEVLLLIAEAFGGWGFMARDGKAIYRHDDLSETWKISRGFKYPESVAYDAGRDLLYVSNYNAAGPGFISKVSLDGEVIDMRWVEGLARPTGIMMHDGMIYVVERTGVAKIDPETGTIVERINIPGAGLLNDIVFAPSGEMYISDTRLGVIFKHDGVQSEVWLESPEISQCNALSWRGEHLLIGSSGTTSVKRVNPRDRNIETFISFDQAIAIDGLSSREGAGYLVGGSRGKLFAVTEAGEKIKLLDTTTPQINAADFVYIPARHMVVIPTFTNNGLTAYTITR